MTDDLEDLFSHYSAQARPLAQPVALGNAGGLSGAELWKYESAIGRLVARAWPVERPNPAALGQIHRWLGELGDLGFLPVPIPGLDGRTFRQLAGRLWEIAPWMPGDPDPNQPPQSHHLRSGFVALALVHQRLSRHSRVGSSPGLSARLRELELLRLGGLAFLERAVMAAEPGEVRELSLQWLARARTLADSVAGIVRSAALRAAPLQPCLRDVRPDHLLFEGERLTGLVDFGAMGIDSVAADLSRLLAEWIGTHTSSRADALAAYESIRPLSACELALIPAFEASTALLIGSHWTRWRFVEKRRFEIASAARDGLRRSLDRLNSLAFPPVLD